LSLLVSTSTTLSAAEIDLEMPDAADCGSDLCKAAFGKDRHHIAHEQRLAFIAGDMQERDTQALADRL
jgi:hypothetical protein